MSSENIGELLVSSVPPDVGAEVEVLLCTVRLCENCSPSVKLRPCGTGCSVGCSSEEPNAGATGAGAKMTAPGEGAGVPMVTVGAALTGVGGIATLPLDGAIVVVAVGTGADGMG